MFFSSLLCLLSLNIYESVDVCLIYIMIYSVYSIIVSACANILLCLSNDFAFDTICQCKAVSHFVIYVRINPPLRVVSSYCVAA